MGNHSSLLVTFAGIAVFLFGMSLASENLQKLAANRIRDWLSKLSDKPYLGVFLGIILTICIQSSGAVTSMLVGLGTAGVITLQQVMGVILGTAIGTTVTVQLLSLKVAEYGILIFTISFFIYFLSNRRTVRRLMKAVMGFGLIFWGLEIIGFGTMALKNAELFLEGINYLKQSPLLAIVCTAVFTAVVHSSAATIGFAMTLAANGTISLYDAIFWVYGANIGTTATALLASAGGNYVGRRVAWAHCFFKVSGVIFFYFVTEAFAGMMMADNIQRSVANSHTVFNVVAALLFYPFIKWGSKAIEVLFPMPDSEKAFSTKYLQRGDFDSPSVVIAHAEREILRLGDIVRKMIEDSIELFVDQDKELYLKMRENDDKVDLLNREISLHLTGFMDNSDSSEQSTMIRLVSFATDLESAADVIDKSMIDLAGKKHNLKLEFSEQGWRELRTVHSKVVEITALSLTCFQRNDAQLAQEIVNAKRSLKVLEKEYRMSHIERLVEGRRESINTSSIHLDLLSDYLRVVGLVSNHTYAIARGSDSYNVLSKKD